MSVTAKCLIESQALAGPAALLYTAPSATRTIIDKFTATNPTGSPITINVFLVPVTLTPNQFTNQVIALSVAANSVLDITQLQNQILNSGDFISASGGGLVVRASGREVQ